jgi:hypothetical protein
MKIALKRGGSRKGAGRPQGLGPKRVRINPSVLPETYAKLNRLSFNLLISAGEVLDRVVGRFKEKIPTKPL